MLSTVFAQLMDAEAVSVESRKLPVKVLFFGVGQLIFFEFLLCAR